jgi:hypothetical protein
MDIEQVIGMVKRQGSRRCQGRTSIVGITHVEFEKTRARLSKPRLQILGEIAVLWPVRFEIGRDMTLAAPEAGYNGFRGAHKPRVSHNQHHSLVDHTTGHTTLLTIAEQIKKSYGLAILTQ